MQVPVSSQTAALTLVRDALVALVLKSMATSVFLTSNPRASHLFILHVRSWKLLQVCMGQTQCTQTIGARGCVYAFFVCLCVCVSVCLSACLSA